MEDRGTGRVAPGQSRNLPALRDSPPMNRLSRTPLLVALVAAAGCMQGPAALDGINVATVAAKGKVLQANGQPLKAGIVTFEPLVDGGSTNQAAGPVGEDGSFEVRSGPSHPGAMPGKYRVKVENENGSKTLTNPAKKVIEIEVPASGVSDLEIRLP